MTKKRNRTIVAMLLAIAGVVMLGIDRLFVFADSGSTWQSIGIGTLIGLWLLIVAVIWFAWST